MKKTWPVLLALLLLAAPAGVQAQSGDGFDYSMNSGDTSTITITKYTGPGGAVTIPTNINGLTIASIGEDAFQNCNTLASVTIPGSVTNIGNWAFQDCTSLTSVTIPGSVASIGEEAFQDCTSLTNATISVGVTSIGGEAFSGCDLASVTIPNTVTNIGDAPFTDCPNLTAITVNTNNPAYISLAGVLFNQSQTTLIEYPAGIIGTCYTIPGTVTSIADWAFTYCVSLTSVIIPDSVTNIGNVAFSYCTSLASTSIPGTVTSIGNSAFDYCTNLNSLTIAEGVTSIGENAFENCTSLTSVTIPGTVTNIGQVAFFQCISLTIIIIPGSVTNIAEETFAGCISLTSVYFLGNAPTIPAVDGDVFYNDNNFTAYYVPGTTGWGTFHAQTGVPVALWNLAPVITVQPQSQTNNAGAPLMFSVSATSLYPMVYQWQTNGNNLMDGGSIFGATNSTLTVTDISDSDAANYSVVVSNAEGSVTSSIATLTVIDSPSIVAQPTNLVVLAGTNVAFGVTLTGAAPFSYQ